MRKLLLLLMLGTTLFAAGCKKDDDKADTTPPEATEDIIEIKTSYGSMYIWLNKYTPLHRTNFFHLAETDYLDNTTFHRCATNFVIQGGDPLSKDADPNNDGQGGPNYMIPAEINTAKYLHDYGAVGAARNNNPQKMSNGSQFYIVTQNGGSHFLDGNYTVFGKVLKGMDVAETINNQPKNGEIPITKVAMDVNVVKKTLSQLKSEFNFTPED